MRLPFQEDKDLHEPFSRVAWWRKLMNYAEERPIESMEDASFTLDNKP